MSHIALAAAIIFEVAGTTAMKLSYGLTRPYPVIAMFILYGGSLAFLAVALKTYEVSIAYAIWAGAGTLLVGFIGVLWFKEPLTTLKMISTLLVVAGVAGLHLSGGGR